VDDSIAAGGGSTSVAFGDITGAPTDNTALSVALGAKQDTLANAAALARITAVAGGPPKWDGGDWPGGGGSGGESVGSKLYLAFNYH